MSKIFDKELKTMQRLINYGVNEDTNNNSQSVVEYHATAADGKTYGIIRECNKYYIKVAPKKDTAILAEDYDYIGGFNNRKENEYSSYSTAANHLDLKLRAINEALDKKNNFQYVKPIESAEWQVNETKEMRHELDRYHQLVTNVDAILNEGKIPSQIPSQHTTPEAPKSSSSSKNSPFTDTAVAKGDKDVKTQNSNYATAGSPFSVGGVVTNKDMESDKKPSGKSEDVYNEKPSFGPKFDKDSVATKKVAGKSVKMNEGRTIKLSENQVLAWNKSKDYMDTSHGTSIGDSAPYDEDSDIEIVYEDSAVHNTDGQDVPTPGTGSKGSSSPFSKKVNEVTDPTDVMGFNDADEDDIDLDDDDIEDDIDLDDDGFEDDDISDDEMDRIATRNAKDVDTDELLRNWNVLDDDEDGYGDYDDEIFENKRKRRRMNEEHILHDFGKHPAYRKKVMSLPPNTEIDRWGRDWNDKSAKTDEPFGKRIGKSDPYTEKVIDMLTDAVLNELSLHRKKKV